MVRWSETNEHNNSSFSAPRGINAAGPGAALPDLRTSLVAEAQPPGFSGVTNGIEVGTGAAGRAEQAGTSAAEVDAPAACRPCFSQRSLANVEITIGRKAPITVAATKPKAHATIKIAIMRIGFL
jgi:hypothetical protein